MAFKYPIEGPVILGAAQCQHLIAVALVPPCPRALEPHMTNEFVRRFNATTANGIAPSTHFPIVGPISMGLEIGFDHGAGHPLLLLYDAKISRGENVNNFNSLYYDPFIISASLF